MKRRKVPVPKAQLMQELFDELPTIDCYGRCWDSCGPLQIAGFERDRIKRESDISIPHGSFINDGPSLCPALTKSRHCAVYEIRPLICRLWGMTEDMPCTYGCKPSRVLSTQEAHALLARACEIAGEDEQAALHRYAADPANAAELERARRLTELEARRVSRAHGLHWQP